MKIIKRAAKKALSSFGYELRSRHEPTVRYQNFMSLAGAYEARLNEQQDILPPNEARLTLLGRLQGTPPSQAYYILQALARCKHIPGDVCEFGVAQGETSALIANEILPFADKRFHLFDSFAGLPKPSDKDQLKDDIFALGSMEAYAGKMAFPEDLVRSRLAAVSFPPYRYVIHKGFFDQVLLNGKNLPDKVCCAYVDFDFYEPIKQALEYLHRVTSAGSILLVDDYDFFSTGAKTAVDEFVEGHNVGQAVYDVVIPDACYGKFALLTRKL